MEPIVHRESTVAFESNLTGWAVDLPGGSRNPLDLALMTGAILFGVGIMLWMLWMLLFGLAAIATEGLSDALAFLWVIPTQLFPGVLMPFLIYFMGSALLRRLDHTRLEVVGTDLRVRRWWAGREQPPLHLSLSALEAPQVQGTLWRQKLRLTPAVALPVYLNPTHREQLLGMLGESITFARQYPEQVPPVPAALQALLAHRGG